MASQPGSQSHGPRPVYPSTPHAETLGYSGRYIKFTNTHQGFDTIRKRH